MPIDQWLHVVQYIHRGGYTWVTTCIQNVITDMHSASQRDPSVNPASPSCTNPKSVTMIKCSFWGGPVDSSTANNAGQYRSQFQVVIAGSNGYQNNSITTPPGYSQPRFLGNSAINAPLDSYGFNSYLGSAIFNSGPFDVALCASACSDKSKYALANPPNDGSPVATCKVRIVQGQVRPFLLTRCQVLQHIHSLHQHYGESPRAILCHV